MVAGIGRIINVVSVKKDGDVVIVGRASLAHIPVLTECNVTLA